MLPKRLFVIFCMISFAPCAFAQWQSLRNASLKIQRALTQNVRPGTKPYIKPVTNVPAVTTAGLSTSHTFKPRPIDKMRHSISSQTTIIGSEKKEAFKHKHTSAKEWKAQMRRDYYSPQDRYLLRELLNTQLTKIRISRPAVNAHPYALEDYLYRNGATDGLDSYLAPMYRDVLRLEAQVTKEVLPYITSAAFSEEGRRLDPRPLNAINAQMLSLINASGKLLNFIPEDTFLKEVNSFYTEVYRVFNPLLGSLVGNVKMQRPDGRIFHFNEFFLFSPEGKDYALYNANTWSEQAQEEAGSLHYLVDKVTAEREQLIKNIPENWHIAILNDDLPPLQNFKKWAQEGNLGRQAAVSTFEDGNDLLASLKAGAERLGGRDAHQRLHRLLYPLK